MKVLFIEIDTESEWAVASIGPAFIAAFLRRHGHEVDFIRVPVAMSSADLVEQVRLASPGVLGVSLTSRQWQRGRALVRAIRDELAGC